MSSLLKGRTRNSKHAHLFGSDETSNANSSQDDAIDALFKTEETGKTQVQKNATPSTAAPEAPQVVPKADSPTNSNSPSPPLTSSTNNIKSQGGAAKTPPSLADLTGDSSGLFDRKNSSPATSTGPFTASASTPFDEIISRRKTSPLGENSLTKSPFDDPYTKAITPSESSHAVVSPSPPPKPTPRPYKKPSTPLLRSSASSISSIDIFERDIEHISPVEHITQQEAVDIGIPPRLDDAVEAFVNDDIEIALPGGISLSPTSSSSPTFSPPPDDMNPWATPSLTDDLSNLNLKNYNYSASPASQGLNSPPASPQPRDRSSLTPNSTLKRRSIRIDLSQPNSPIITGLKTPPSELHAQFFNPPNIADSDPFKPEFDEDPRWGATHSRTISETLGNAGTIREIRGLSGVWDNPWK